jgi:hypothetical protein
MTDKPRRLVDFVDSESDTYTGKTSDTVRALLMAATGIVWLLGGGTGDPAAVLAGIGGAWTLTCALILAVIGLLFDAFQYAWASWCWPRYGRVLRSLVSGQEDAWAKAKRWGLNKRTIDEQGGLEQFMTNHPTWSPGFMNGLTNGLFWAKTLCACLAYLTLASHAVGAMF